MEEDIQFERGRVGEASPSCEDFFFSEKDFVLNRKQEIEFEEMSVALYYCTTLTFIL